MTRIRISMLSLLAVLAVSAVSSASASAACYQVAEAGTGNKDSSCTTNVGSSEKEYINVSALTTKLKPGEYCAKVETAGTGTFELNTCAGVPGTKEFIKVLVPEFVHCIAQAGGLWMAGCKLAGTTFEKVPVPAGSKIKFASTSGVSYLYANNAGTFRIRCAKDKDKGEITSANTVAHVIVTFEECKGIKGTEECPVKSVGAVGAEEIVTKELSGGLGTVAAEASSSETGLDLKPTTGTTLVELVGSPTTCVPQSKVEGSVIGEVTPVNVMDPNGTVIFGVKGRTKTKQTIQKFVGEAKDTLAAFGSAAGFESTDVIAFEEAIEVTPG
jgi:hypothetical protein